ncbi:MlaD family protein [Telmatobacter sp. DSM 110680]|uniref:MlaD family protein n=1 Tax=Telmatobacter sp. DSM 110680 TaxID=3036704 RepID=A0AAU7DGZ5_9BACT
MPSRKEIQWSQLRVGALVLAALAVLVLVILLMSSASGGLFAHKLTLRTYFNNAGGLKSGAPVTLEGVTIGNITKIRVVPERSPTPVEVSMRVGGEYIHFLHSDSTTSIVQAGVLGDSFVDITSAHATGPAPANNTELRSTEAPSLQGVISASQDSIDQITKLMKNANILMDTLNSKRGTIGGFINDPAFYAKLNHIADNLDKLTGAINNGQGTLGKLVNDDTLYTHVDSVVGRFDNIAQGIQNGQGTAGKLVKDDTLYNNLNSTVANANQLLADVNSGKGSIGKLAKDPEFAKKLDDAVTRLDSLLTGIDEGKGTIGQLMQNRSVYDHTDQTMDQAKQLLQAIRQDPKKYFVIRLKLF